MLNKFMHWLSHRLGINEGKIISWQENDNICIGFECSQCEEIDPSTVDRIPLNEMKQVSSPSADIFNESEI